MLTVGFHNANPPLIWRFDLERNHSFTLALQGEDADWELGVTSPKGDFYPVAHFAAREDAEEAFVKLEKALSMKKAASSIVAKSLLALVAVVVLVAAGVTLFGFYVSHKVGATSTTVTLAAPSPAQPQTPAVIQLNGLEPGVPLSADDVLKPPR
jgi:hypothetical protein